MIEMEASAPKTDRELLLRLDQKIDNLIEKIQGQDGNGGFCAELVSQGARIGKLENWRWYIAGMGCLLLLLVGLGRIIEFLYIIPRK